MKPLVRYEPRKEVIIHEYTRCETVQDLVRSAGAPLGTTVFITLRWASGIAMIFSALPMNEITTKEIIEGRLHWDHVSFAPMEKFQPKVHDESSGVTASVVDVSGNATFFAIAEFIKAKLLKPSTAPPKVKTQSRG